MQTKECPQHMKLRQAGMYPTNLVFFLFLVALFSMQPVWGAKAAQTPQLQSSTPQTPAPPASTGAPRISEIVVRGNHNLNSTYIIGASGAKEGDLFTPELQQQMQQNLLNTGLFGVLDPDPMNGVRVYSEEPNPPNGTCKVIIDVDENPLITNISITGTGPIKPEVVQAQLQGLKPGTVFNIQQFITDVNAIIDLYQKQHYIAQISQDTPIDSAGVLHINLIVTKVASINIVGLHKTRKIVVLREMKTKVGGYFNTEALEQDRVALLNTDLFDDVRPSITSVGPGEVSITLNITEKRTGEISAAVGYSDTARFVGYIQLAENNFRGLGERVSVRGEVGGIAGRSSVELDFTEPYLGGRHTTLNVQLYDKTVYRFSSALSAANPIPPPVGSTAAITNNYYSEQRTGGIVTLSRPFGRFYTASVGIRAENVRTDLLNLPPNDLSIIQNGPIESVSGFITRDTRDLYLDPSKGGVQQLSLEIGHANINTPRTLFGIPVASTIRGSVNFLRTSLEARQYISLSGQRPLNNPTKPETVLAIRALVGTSTGTLPFFEQFFIGGADTLRGYRDDRFWGKYEFLTSVELRQPLAPKFTGVLFTDIGDAWGGPYSNLNINGFSQGGFHPRIGTGLGIRVVTPLGLIRLDYGIGSEGGRIHFSFGSTF